MAASQAFMSIFLHISWFLDSSESDSASWEIAQVTLKDEGYYECIAISSAGTGRAQTFLDVSGNRFIDIFWYLVIHFDCIDSIQNVLEVFLIIIN